MPGRTSADLGPYSDIVDVVRAQAPLFPSGDLTCEAARDVLRFTAGVERPLDLRVERTWERDGLIGEELSWSVGFGPRTHGFLLKPAGAKGKLPGIVACYDHGHFKLFGKEKIADGPDGAAGGRAAVSRHLLQRPRLRQRARARGFRSPRARHVPVGKPEVSDRGHAAGRSRARRRDRRNARARCDRRTRYCAITAPRSCTSTRSRNT